MSPRSAYPLRAILFIEEFGEGGSRNKVKLVCGHSVRSDATYRARCHECAKDAKIRAEGGMSAVSDNFPLFIYWHGYTDEQQCYIRQDVADELFAALEAARCALHGKLLEQADAALAKARGEA